MVEISNAQAEEIIAVTDALRRMCFGMTDKRSENTKRRAKLVIRYIERKKYGKKKET
jgi:hypothetical protein